jgi:hypothetical protein
MTSPRTAPQLRLLDAPCDDFDRAWQTGRRPDPAGYLDRVEVVLRPQLLQELLRIELEWRCRLGERPAAKEYAGRYPACAGQIANGLPQRSTPGAIPRVCRADRAIAPCHRVIAPSTAPAPPLRSLGEYDLLERLGGGGMGDVYLARHRRLDRLVAMKVLSGHREPSPQARARFLREMKALAALEHAGVVEALDAGECDGTVYSAAWFTATSSLPT